MAKAQAAGRILANAYANSFAANQQMDNWDRISKLEQKNAQLWTMLGQRDKEIDTFAARNATLRTATEEAQGYKEKAEALTAQLAESDQTGATQASAQEARVSELELQVRRMNAQLAEGRQREEGLRASLKGVSKEIEGLVLHSVGKFKAENERLEGLLAEERSRGERFRQERDTMKREQSIEVEANVVVAELRRRLHEQDAEHRDGAARWTRERETLERDKAELERGGAEARLAGEAQRAGESCLRHAEGQMQACRGAVGDVTEWVRRTQAGECPAISGLMEDSSTAIQQKQKNHVAALGLKGGDAVAQLVEAHGVHATSLAEDVDYLRMTLIDHYADALICDDMSDKCHMQ